MPELPDVEVFKRYLNATSLHQTIRDVEVEDRRILHRLSAQRLKRSLIGHKFQSSSRHGKYVFVQLDNAHLVYFHFGMTGGLKYFKRQEKRPEYGRVFFHFANGYRLAYISQRLLGKIGLATSMAALIEKRNLGIDALRMTFGSFKSAVRGREGAAKSFLMNQRWIAGIGNIYADEILFQSSIHPEAKMDRLPEERLRILFRNIQEVLKKAVAGHADPNRLPRAYLIPQRKKRGKCPRSHGELKHIRVGGRSTYFCPVCQGR
jgi:formamidopyrimidine-DNA glycosylase